MKTRMIIFSLAILVLGSGLKVKSQSPIFDILVKGVTLVKLSNGGGGSGVIIADDRYLYLVTAKHVLFDMKSNQLLSSDIRLIYYLQNPFYDNADSMYVDLRGLYLKGLLRFHSNNDIAIVQIAKVKSFDRKDGAFVFEYSPHTKKYSRYPGGIFYDLAIPSDSLSVSEDAFMFGFPASLSLAAQNDYDFTRPLLRKGVIAGKSGTAGTIIIDCPSYQGNSGGPVFKYSLNRNERHGLIGIVSRSIVNIEFEQNVYYQSVNTNIVNSGYTVVVPIEYALELMKTMK